MARRSLAAPFASPPQALTPFVPASRALQPDPLGRTVGDLRRLQVAVLGGVPKVQDARVQALGAIEALQRQPPAAVRASGIAERPRPLGQLPTVATLAASPHSGRIAARDVGRLEGPVPLLVPLRQQIRIPKPQTPCPGWARSGRISPNPALRMSECNSSSWTRCCSDAGLRSSANSSSGFIAPSPSLRMSWLNSIGRVVTPLILTMQS